MNTRRNHNQPRRLSASDLSALGYCERKAMYAHHKRAGRVDSGVAAARRRGEVEHARRHREVTSPMPAGARTSPCFIASAIYGPDAWQTNALRGWRDRVLMPRRSGRLVVLTYYRLSPPIAAMLMRRPHIAFRVRRVLDVLVRHVG